MFPYPVLLCDLGGTNCRFSAVDGPDGEPELLDRVGTDAFATFADAASAVSEAHSIRPGAMIVCAAGPLQGRSVQMTNASWSIDGPLLAQRLTLQQGLLLNDFEALALSLPAMEPEWTRPIGSAQPVAGRPQIILGPGTGLGTAALVRTGGQGSAGRQVLALETEAGHTGFAAGGDEEEAVWRILKSVHRRITPETILCGSGLVRLHGARIAAAGGGPYREADADADDLTPAHITARALADTASEEAQTVRLFWRLLARFAGDIALTFFAQGGVTLAGGILPRIEPLLDAAAFRRQFEDKDPMRMVVEATPVRLLMRPDAVHHGMAAIAANPGDFVLDYAHRCWR